VILSSKCKFIVRFVIEENFMKEVLRILILLTIALTIALDSGVLAAVKPHGLISNSAVLQQGVNVPVWGTANNGEKVTVKFQKQEVSTIAQDGKWMVQLKPLYAGGPFAMIISGENTIELYNILVGEVWVCSGQSNMEFPISLTANAQEVITASKDPRLRLFTVPRAMSNVPLHDLAGNWQECGTDTIPHFSAVGYYFGVNLRKALNVPVGLIHSSWGGTAIQPWMSSHILRDNPERKNISKSDSGVLYNAMITPLQSYAIQGVIWYQGECNANEAFQYRSLFPAMIRSWREDWGQGKFPFLFVQLAPWKKIKPEPQDSAWAELRETQLLTSLNVPRTAMVVITDAGDQIDIHPKQKEPVGARLAMAALAVAYGRHIVYHGPIYKTMSIKADKAILTFKHVGGGLTTRNGTLRGFTIAGADRKFFNAHAEIRRQTVIVWSPQVLNPVAVRYGWADYPVVNLYNKEGLPASPFRTDDYPIRGEILTVDKALRLGYIVDNLVKREPCLRTFFTVDLSLFCNRTLSSKTATVEKGGFVHGSELPDNDLRELPLGQQRFASVPFYITDGSIVLRTPIHTPSFPEVVTEIPVGRKVGVLYFLHASAWGGNGKAWDYIVKYIDGYTINIPMVVGLTVIDWWLPRKDLPLATLAWTGKNPKHKSLGVYMCEWVNPEPDQPIVSISIVSAMNTAVPVILAITGGEPL